MEDKYKVEGPSQKYTRFQYWVTVVRRMEERFNNGHHLVLAKEGGGDISSLIGFGVDPKSIVAVEPDQQSAYETQERWPSVRVVCSDVVQMAKEYRRKLTSAYLDFGAPLTQEMLKTAGQVIVHGLRDEAMIGITVLSGLETGELAEGMEKEAARMIDQRVLSSLSDLELILLHRDMSANKNDSHLAALHREITSVLETQNPTKAAKLADRLRAQQSMGYDASSKSIVRLHYLLDHLRKQLDPLRTAIQPIALFQYTSRKDPEKKLPAAVILFQIRRLIKTMPERRFHDKVFELAVEWGFPVVHDCNVSDAQLRREVLSYLQYLEEKRRSGETPTATIRAASAKAALLWNLPTETIAAWKAHNTRGTYKDEER